MCERLDDEVVISQKRGFGVRTHKRQAPSMRRGRVTWAFVPAKVYLCLSEGTNLATQFRRLAKLDVDRLIGLLGHEIQSWAKPWPAANQRKPKVFLAPGALY